MESGYTACKMLPVNFITVLAMILVLLLHTCSAQTPCTTNGWFGPDCQYQCHCAGSAVCDKDDGSCSSGCHTDWFGPACQYRKMRFTSSAANWWLTDSSDTTCYPSWWTVTNTVTVTLTTPIPLTWIRVVVSNEGYLNQTTISACQDYRIVQVDEKTEDIFCSSQDPVNQITLSGPSVRGLCSLYINGGRNVALKQRAEQGSRYTGSDDPNRDFYPYLAQNAVDGWTGANAQSKSDIQSTCSHTADEDDGRSWWTVTFSHSVEIIWFQIYNRNFAGCCARRLRNFSLTAQPQSNTDTSYAYRGPDIIRNSYTVVPSSRIKFPVSQVRFEEGDPGIENILTLCEVFVYGETSCPAGLFGLRCERQCKCADQTESCFVHSGGCPSGCAAGFTGEDCYTECPDRKYGQGCLQTCNDHCGGPDNLCNNVDGRCNNGCDAGYTGDHCDQLCPEGSYGQGCSQICNEHCGGPDDLCNNVDGKCSNDCDAGYTGDFCDQRCPNGTYGIQCVAKCSVHCAGQDKPCHHVDGTCLNGCETGYQPGLCNQTCEIGHYGRNCEETCSDHCAGEDNLCNHVNGTCNQGCDPGYRDDLCMQMCPATMWGQDCVNNCSVQCVDRSCDPVSGECVCAPGFTGETCIQQRPQSSGDGSGSDSTIPAVVGAVVAVVVILAVVAAVLLWRRRRRKADGNRELEGGTSLSGKPSKNSGADFDLRPVLNNNRNSELQQKRLKSDKNRKSKNHAKQSKGTRDASTTAKDGYDDSSEEDSDHDMAGRVNVLTGDTAVPVENLPAYIIQHSSDTHLKDEFSSIPMANSSPQTCGVLPQNIKKNRYKNIIPYDSSRVLLQADQENNPSDYINASYVKGYKNDQAFIASQGPNDLILHDFVRMLWEQRVDRVVMLTNIVELGKKKCSMYWPVEGEEEFGAVSIRLLTTHVFAEYTIRHLRLSKSGESPRDLTQFHFTAWPDKSVPESPWGLVDLYQRVMSNPGTGPLLVHCSAGVGRTGTFLALCNLLEEAEATGKMDFLRTLWKLRQDRMHTIQTIAQYIFLHKVALVGHTISGTSVQVKDLSTSLAGLESDTSKRSYKQEFDAIVTVCDATTTQPDEISGQEESVYENNSAIDKKNKNRLNNILPNETFRPILIAEAHKEDTYINAVLVPNLTKTSQDILTQVPMPTTVTDFWRLVIQFNVDLVVAFDTESHEDKTVGDFLPRSEKQPFVNERYRVTMTSHTGNNLAKELSLTVHQKVVPGMDSSAKPETKNLTFLQCKKIDMDHEHILQLYETINQCRPNEKSRIVYMCRNGADLSGLMCVQSILLDRLEVDQCLTVPLVVGTIKAIRPQVIPTVDQYKCLYQVLNLAHESQNVYGNVES